VKREDGMTRAQVKRLSSLADALQRGWRMFKVVKFEDERTA
jgi:hypothetical protein